KLGIPVVVTRAHRRHGLDALREAIVGLGREPVVPPPPRPLPDAFYAACDNLRDHLHSRGEQSLPDYLLARMILDPGGSVEALFVRKHGAELHGCLQEIRDRLATEGCRVPIVEARSRYAWARDVLSDVVT